MTYYLIKWRDSNYDMATWEPEDSPIPDFKKSIENYENLRLVSFLMSYLSFKLHCCKGSLTVWALYAYFSDFKNAAFEPLVWCMSYQRNR